MLLGYMPCCFVLSFLVLSTCLVSVFTVKNSVVVVMVVGTVQYILYDAEVVVARRIRRLAACFLACSAARAFPIGLSVFSYVVARFRLSPYCLASLPCLALPGVGVGWPCFAFLPCLGLPSVGVPSGGIPSVSIPSVGRTVGRSVTLTFNLSFVLEKTPVKNNNK